MKKQTKKKKSMKLSIIALGTLLFKNAYAGAVGWEAGMDAIDTGNTGLSNASIYSIAAGFLTWILGVLTIITVISFIITGIMFIFSSANEKLKESAKTGVTYSIIGIIISLSGYIIIKFVGNLLNAGLVIP